MQPAVNVASKSQLAKLLATENISVRHVAGASTASFDVKNRVLTLPVWKEMSNDLYDMLVIHEVGHALDTPSEGWVDAIKAIAKKHNGDEKRGAANIKGFLNVVEDARIDKRQKRRFPGSRRNYVIAYKELFDRDFFSIKNRDVNSLTFIDRMNIYFKGGFAMGIKFDAAERAFLKRAEDAETWEQVLQLTEDIYAYAKSKKEEEKEQLSKMDDFQDEGDDDNDDQPDYGDDDWDDEAEDEDEAAGDGKGEEDENSDADDDAGDGESESDGNQEEDTEADAEKTSNGNSGDVDSELPESETDKAFEERKQELNADAENAPLYIEVPEANLAHIVDDYKVVLNQWRGNLASVYDPDRVSRVMMEEFNKWKSDENASISFMVKEFESKKAADIYSRISTAKTGVIDTNKLHSYKYNEDVFRRLSVIPQGKNHGFVMFLDWSGSMDNFFRSTLKQLFSMVLFCKRAQIPFDVYSFRSIQDEEHGNASKQWSSDKDISFCAFRLRNILSSRMNGADLNFAMAYMLMANGRGRYDYLGSTPLNQAIACADQIVNQFRTKYKCQIVNTIFLTDGDSDPSHINAPLPSRKARVIISDRKTGKEYNVGSYANTPAMTDALLNRLKDRTGCNLVGFFLTSGSFRRISYSLYRNYVPTQEYLEKMEKFYKDENFVPVTSSGYDKYFVINGNKMKFTDSNLEVSNEMSKAKVASAFRKFSQSKTVNRVLLRQFIDLVAA